MYPRMFDLLSPRLRCGSRQCLPPRRSIAASDRQTSPSAPTSCGGPEGSVSRCVNVDGRWDHVASKERLEADL